MYIQENANLNSLSENSYLEIENIIYKIYNYDIEEFQSTNFYNFFFNPLKSFTLKNNDQIHDFINEYNDFNQLLRKIPNIIHKYFPNTKLSLEFVPDPEIDMDQLLLYIKTEITEKNVDELYEKVYLIEKDIKYLLTHSIHDKILIDLE
jgi:hypothetical protein